MELFGGCVAFAALTVIAIAVGVWVAGFFFDDWDDWESDWEDRD